MKTWTLFVWIPAWLACMINLSCSDSEDDPALSWQDEDLATEHSVSGCGGFGAPSTKLREDATGEESVDDEGGAQVEEENPDDELDSMCGDERLTWSYDPSNRALTLYNKDIFLNCCGNHSVGIVQQGDAYIFKEVDQPEDGSARCDCMCLFDFKVILADVDQGNLALAIHRHETDQTESEVTIWQGNLDLSEGSGEVMIEENVGWCDVE